MGHNNTEKSVAVVVVGGGGVVFLQARIRTIEMVLENWMWQDCHVDW
jgi:hypothetical protein